jgi:dephospho-CoA kinase
MGMLIMKRIFKRIFKNIITGKNVMLIDAPLLYESKILEYVCYPVVLVGCC